MTQRQIIEIDESKCDGCGQCIRDCAEGALEIVNGKAKVIADILCDGLGACLSGCPQNALKIVQREAAPFDEAAVHARMHGSAAETGNAGGSGCACPGAAAREFAAPPRQFTQLGQCAGADEATRHWPVKVRLAPAAAPFLRGAHVLITADCAGAASAELHAQAQGKLMLIACPKFESREELVARIRAMIADSGLASLDVLRMEVPCCAGLTQVCRQAALEADAPFQVHEYIMRRDGQLAQIG